MSVVALDTMTIIWGMRRSKKDAGADLQRRASILPRQLDDEKSTVVVPSVVVAELLAGIDKEKHGDMIAELRRRFVCPSFDPHAASIAATLWQAHRKLAKSEQLSRSVLKAEVMIIATAAAAECRVIYSHDPKCRRLAQLAKLIA